MMEFGEEIRKALVNNKSRSEEATVPISLGELRYLVETVRCQALELDKTISKAQSEATRLNSYFDPLDTNQVKYRLEYLYKQLTGLDPKDGLRSLK